MSLCRWFSLSAVFTNIASAAVLPRTSSINWGPCKETEELQCGCIEVPKDYTDLTAGNITLNLVRYQATVKPSKGSILYNPGGPGLSGRSQLVPLAPLLTTMLGGEFDIISWDPRGTGLTLTYDCFKNATQRAALNDITPVTSNYSADGLADIETVWKLKGELAAECAVNAKDVGTLVGTAFTARDMMKIVDALGEDGLLRYWGMSYGSILGMTAAAMFPDRVGRLVIDGVLNPKGYYAGEDVSQIADTDVTFSGFTAACIASPQYCDFAASGLQGPNLDQQVYALLNQLKTNPIPVTVNGTTSYITYGLLKSSIFSALYAPLTYWPLLGTALQAIITDDQPVLQAIIGYLVNTTEAHYFPNDNDRPEAIPGIRCSDTTLRTTNVMDIVPLVDSFYVQSRMGGDYLSVYQPLTCPQWPFSAKERPDTDWNVKTKSPVLFIGNMFDPVTSLNSAFNASSGFEGSVVLVQDGYGHSSLAQPSRCTGKYVAQYFADGTLPEPGTICPVDVNAFTNLTFIEGYNSPQTIP